MIRLKTSVLVAAALKMGAIVAQASDSDADLLYEYGLNLGLAFQLQDDYLDTFWRSGKPLESKWEATLSKIKRPFYI